MGERRVTFIGGPMDLTVRVIPDARAEYFFPTVDSVDFVSESATEIVDVARAEYLIHPVPSPNGYVWVGIYDRTVHPSTAAQRKVKALRRELDDLKRGRHPEYVLVRKAVA